MATKSRRRGGRKGPPPARPKAETIPASADDRGLPRALPPPVAAGTVFVAAGSVLVLEILAVRLLAPYVGLTLEATTAIIGAALAGIAVGAAIGGRLADRTNTRLLVVCLLLLGGLLALLMVPVVRWLGPGARGDGGLAAVGITLIALVPPAASLSAVSPAVAHLQLHDLHASGTIVGRLSAWATAGALIGTFGTGFVLIPLMPVGATVLAIGTVLIVAGIVLGATSRVFSTAGALGVAVAALVLAGVSASVSSPCDTETKYHCVILERDPGQLASYNLRLDDGYHAYIDLAEPTTLIYPYTKWMADAIDSTNPPRVPLDAVAIGGGGLTQPRWLIATRPGSHVRVLEVDGELVDFLERRLGLKTATPQLEVSIGDARTGMLDLADDSADVVIGDAFSSDSVPWHLATAEWTDEVERVLRPGGLYTLNVLDFQPLELTRAVAATLLDSFADVRLVTFPAKFRGEGLYGGNVVLLASDRPMPDDAGSSAAGAITEDLQEVEAFAGDAQILRDDFAPADQLLTNKPDG